MQTNNIYDGRKPTDIDLFATGVCINGSLLGLDHGKKNVGIAISDETRTIASPIGSCREKKLAGKLIQLQKIIVESSVCGVVLGLPLNMNGTSGPRSQAAWAFATTLQAELKLPVIMWDERQTTVIAERSILETDVSRRKRAQKIDQIAATLILQSFLNRLKLQTS